MSDTRKTRPNLKRYYIYHLVVLALVLLTVLSYSFSQFHHALVLHFPLEFADTVVRALLKRTVVVTVIVLCIAALPALLFFQSLRDSLLELRSFISHYAVGDLSEKLGKSDIKELAELKSTLNDLTASVDWELHNLREQRNRLETTFSSMVEAVLLLDLNNRVISLNNAAEKMLRVTAETSIGRGVNELFDSVDLRQLLRASARRGERLEGEVALAGRENRVLEARVAPSRDDHGELTGSLIVLNDVTEMKQFEKMRRDFVANVSHELKTPVTSIKGFVETLLDGAMNDQEQLERFLRIISGQADRLGSIVEDLLTLARLETVHVDQLLVLRQEPVNGILRSVMEAWRETAARRHISLEIDCPSDLIIPADHSLLEQAIGNLVDNAIKYSPERTTVKLIATAGKEAATVTIVDQGPGIEESHQLHIFERFYRVDKARSRKLGGTGLGLAIVKQIAGLHHGEVSLQSALGKGSAFTLTLPYQK